MNTRTLFALAAVAALCASTAMAFEPRGNCGDAGCSEGGDANCGHCGHGCCHGGICCHQNAEAARRAAGYNWHGNYYHAAWGAPVALVVPPTAAHQTNYTWGVPATRVTRIDHQFQRPYPGGMGGATGFSPTPRWPSNTNQFGVYYVRGPW